MAVVDCFTTPTTFHVDSRFWLPRQTAERYEAKDLHPYSEWAEAGAITLLDSPTISIEVQQQIAAEIITSHAAHPITLVCYDKAYSGGVIELLKSAGIKCEPIRQGWTVAAGCKELDRRLIEKSIRINPNPVMDFCASNVEVTHDAQGNYWPVKPSAKGKYAGRRSAKIDGIAALCDALVEARKQGFTQPPHVGAEAFSLD